MVHQGYRQGHLASKEGVTKQKGREQETTSIPMHSISPCRKTLSTLKCLRSLSVVFRAMPSSAAILESLHQGSLSSVPTGYSNLSSPKLNERHYLGGMDMMLGVFCLGRH